MSKRFRTLGLIQVAVLSAIEAHPENAYGTALTDRVSDMIGREMPDGQIYNALKRLEQHGFVSASSDFEQVPPKRSRGRPRIYYTLTASGRGALGDAGAVITREQAGRRFSMGGEPDGWKEERPGLTPVVG